MARHPKVPWIVCTRALGYRSSLKSSIVLLKDWLIGERMPSTGHCLHGVGTGSLALLPGNGAGSKVASASSSSHVNVAQKCFAERRDGTGQRPLSSSFRHSLDHHRSRCSRAHYRELHEGHSPGSPLLFQHQASFGGKKQGSCPWWNPLNSKTSVTSKRSFAIGAEAIAKAQNDVDEPSVGRIVQFRNNNKDLVLGIILEFKGGAASLVVEDINGAIHNIKRSQLAYVLPTMKEKEQDEEYMVTARQNVDNQSNNLGTTCDVQDTSMGVSILETSLDRDSISFIRKKLNNISNEIAGYKESLINDNSFQLAWDASEGEAAYTVVEMASLLFADDGPPACAAAHLVLQEQSILFKQIGRRPPMFAARLQEEIKSILSSKLARRALEEERTSFLLTLDSVRKMPPSERPDAITWKNGPFRTIIRMLEDFALGKFSDFTMELDGKSMEARLFMEDMKKEPLDAADPKTVKLVSYLSSNFVSRFIPKIYHYKINKSDIIEILSAAGVSRDPQGASELLRASGFWSPHVQIGLLAEGLSDDRFPENLEKLANHYIKNPIEDIDAAFRKDLTHMEIITVDDEGTTEVDDGLSAEFIPGIPGAVRVWIHVADPTRWIHPRDELDIEARRRTKTLYLPNCSVPMFPRSLSSGLFSLQSSSDPVPGFTISCIVLSDGRTDMDSLEIFPSLLRPSRQFTYDTVDEMLIECNSDEEPILHALHVAAKSRRAYRLKSGALEIQFPEARVDIEDELSDHPVVKIEAQDPSNSRSRQIVAEMMILAGEMSARFGAIHGVPLPYRGQQDPILPSEEELLAAPPGPARSALLRSRMTRSVTVANAMQRHAALGLDGYVQVTSPIRRYGDMLAHWQIKAVLRGEDPPFCETELNKLLEQVTLSGLNVVKLERQANSYWIAHFFKRALNEDSEATWQATFLTWFKQEAGLGKVTLDELGLEMLVKICNPAMPGSSLRVKCSVAEPHTCTVRLEEAS